MIIGFTGSRQGTTPAQLSILFDLVHTLRATLGVHGCCIGADKVFHDTCTEHDIETRVYPASNLPKSLISQEALRTADEVMEAKPAPGRNRYIIRDSDVMLACPSTMVMPVRLQGQGTWTTVKWTRDEGKPLYLILPNGLLIEERLQRPRRRVLLREF